MTFWSGMMAGVCVGTLLTGVVTILMFEFETRLQRSTRAMEEYAERVAQQKVKDIMNNTTDLWGERVFR